MARVQFVTNKYSRIHVLQSTKNDYGAYCVVFYADEIRERSEEKKRECSVAGVDNLDEVWLERGSTHEESIDVSQLTQLHTVISSHRTLMSYLLLRDHRRKEEGRIRLYTPP